MTELLAQLHAARRTFERDPEKARWANEQAIRAPFEIDEQMLKKEKSGE
jgi:hypothetical protein